LDADNLYGIRGIAGNGCFAVGAGGTILRHDGTSWASMTSGKGNNLMAVLGNSRNNIVAVGLEGKVCQYNGNAWKTLDVGQANSLTGVWTSPEHEVFLVGYHGVIMRHDGHGWQTMASGTGATLTGIWGTSSRDVYAVGHEGTLLHFDGTSWSAVDTGVHKILYSVWGTSSCDVYAVGEHGTMLHYDGMSWTLLPKQTAHTLLGVWSDSPGDVFAVGEMGTVLHFDGASWSAMDSGTLYLLNGVWGASSNDVYAVGEQGTTLHFDGTAWNAMTTPTSNSLRKVWGSSAHNVYAVGDAGAILHYGDGTVEDLYALAGTSLTAIDGIGTGLSGPSPLLSADEPLDAANRVAPAADYETRKNRSESLLDFLLILYAETQTPEEPLEGAVQTAAVSVPEETYDLALQDTIDAAADESDVSRDQEQIAGSTPQEPDIVEEAEPPGTEVSLAASVRPEDPVMAPVDVEGAPGIAAAGSQPLEEAPVVVTQAPEDVPRDTMIYASAPGMEMATYVEGSGEPDMDDGVALASVQDVDRDPPHGLGSVSGAYTGTTAPVADAAGIEDKVATPAPQTPGDNLGDTGTAPAALAPPVPDGMDAEGAARSPIAGPRKDTTPIQVSVSSFYHHFLQDLSLMFLAGMLLIGILRLKRRAQND
jgi:hypothetical protein